MVIRDSIFAGANLQVEVGTSAGSTIATDFEVIPEVNTFTTSGFESTVITVKTFNNAYDRKLLGTKSIPDISLAVNYLPDNEVHQKLEQLADDQKRCQIKLSYFEDATKTTGFYVIYTCFVSSTTIGGDKDEVVTKTFTLAVDGAAIDSGLITETP
ncbi:phage tail protein [Klebsiella pneumoniae]|uniref:phage tail protein n=1 Tax=Klebsiella pneumoniae TaxID=573 RepID=UPI001C8276AB|nr:phage tail protein [Klebsiella pneumoniae]